MEEFYGSKDQERLDSDPEETIARLMDDEDYSDFPIKIYVYKPMQIAKNIESFATNIIENIIEDLDEKLSDPDGDYTIPTKNMINASKKLAKVIIDEYKPWMCEKTGEVLEYTEEEAINTLT